MSEDNPPKDPSDPHPSDPTDVVDKIDELLQRHRGKSLAGDVDSSQAHQDPVADGIPVLTDVVMGPGQDAKSPPSPLQAKTINSLLIVRRMALALDAEHARLLAEMGGDANQAYLLDRLVAELKHALPAAVRAAILDKVPDSPRRGDDGQL
jgi:hypothetical protein